MKTFPHNIFPGVNPYLQSRLLESDWRSFHAIFVVDIAKTLSLAVLPLGYIAQPEAGLQVRHIDGDTPGFRVPDVAVYDTGTAAESIATPSAVAATSVVPAAEFVDTTNIPDEYNAVAIRKLGADEQAPVAWLEVLSPSNKLPRSAFKDYATKRTEVLRAGIVFVEVDFIYTQPPTSLRLPNYSRTQSGAYPYHITVIDPRPELDAGNAYTYGFGVLDALPTVTIPLDGDDRVDFDFGVAYRKTFDEGLYAVQINYDREAPAFSQFSTADRDRIRAHLAAQT